MYVDRYLLSLVTPFELIMNSIRFTKYVKRVDKPYKYAVCNPSDLESSQRLSEDNNYIHFNTKKDNFYRFNKY